MEGRPEEQIAAAEREMQEAIVEFGWGSSQQQEARARLEATQRAVAAASGLEWAEVIEVSPLWDSGAPCPFVLASEHGVSVAYYVGRSDPAFDAAPLGGARPVGVLTFDAPDHRFGGPNDEVLSGHPLWDRGLTFYGAHLIHNSRWIDELRTINSVHDRFDRSRGSDANHYLLAFHDTIFECLARSYLSTVVHAPMADVVLDLAEDLASSYR